MDMNWLSAGDKTWADSVYKKITDKMPAVAERTRGKIPYIAQNHHFDDHCPDDICWWTNGFWGGIMWQLYHAASQDAPEGSPAAELYRENAEFVEKELDRNLMEARGMDHDSGFRWLPTAGASEKLTGNPASRNRMMLAANNLAGRFNVQGNFIRAWNSWGDGSNNTGWAIIDCMMNLPLLYEASDHTGDPRFRMIAERHADTAAKNFIREDGSSRHIIEFDPESGEYLCEHGGQGMGDGSSWTRGQSWAVYGFALSYLHTGKKLYLETACRVADHFLASLPESGLVPTDFDQPKACSYQDDTAAAITSSGLILLADELTEDPDRAASYRAAALRMLRALDDNHCDWDPSHDEILTACTAAYHDEKHNFPIIYGDYYFIECILRLTGREVFIW